jgi:hypothetical protein
MRFQYRTVPYRLVPRRDGIEKKRSKAGRDETVSISRGTGRYAVSDSYSGLQKELEQFQITNILCFSDPLEALF